MRNVKVVLLMLVAGALIAQSTRLIVDKQLRVIGAAPGSYLVVGDDGGILSVPAPARLVLGAPGAPGCVLQPDMVTYKLPVIPAMLAVYRNGLRASMPQEFVLNGQTFTFQSQIPGEVVICDFTY